MEKRLGKLKTGREWMEKTGKKKLREKTQNQNRREGLWMNEIKNNNVEKKINTIKEEWMNEK